MMELAEPVRPALAPATGPTPAAWTRLGGRRALRALVVDDAAVNRAMLKTFLVQLGISVETADDGLQAIERFAEYQPDLILMDVLMPNMDGYAATRRIKAMAGSNWIPVVFLSALDKAEHLVAGLDAGGEDYLPKPINFVVLEAKLRSMAANISRYRELVQFRRKTEAIATSMRDGFLVFDEQGVIQKANPAVERMFGYQDEELAGVDMRTLLAPSLRHVSAEHGGSLAADGIDLLIASMRQQILGQRKDGSLFPIEVTSGEVSVADNRRSFFGLVRDVSERQAAEQRLRDANELNEGIMAAAPYGLAAYRASGECVFANARMGAILGASTEDLHAQNFRQMASWAHSGLLEAAEETLADWRPRRVERKVFAGYGKEIWISCGFSVFRRQGEPHLLMTVSDISARMEAEFRLREHTDMLERYRSERESENSLAKDILLRQMRREGLSDPRVRHWHRPTAQFSGDVAAAACSADGKLYVLLADATGHGLGAAISAIPVLTVFYGLAEQKHSLSDMARELNRQLMACVPTGHFVAASLLCIDSESGCAEIWQGGMPDVMLVDATGSLLWRLPSQHLPLGITEFDDEMAEVVHADLPEGCQFVLASDGLHEAVGADGEPFGMERLCRIVGKASAESRMEAIQAALGEHMGNISAHDDISLVLVDTRFPATPLLV